ncbi:MAG: hypothetical protein JSV80_04775, partial [Acidobacteriota bacterium]
MRAPKRITQLVLVTILALGVAAIAPTTPADEEIPRDVKKALDAVIDAKIKDLKEQKNEKDRQYLRGVCAKNYRPQEDGTYRVTFYKDTIFTEKEVKRERFDLTLASKGEDEWEVTNEELVTTLEGFIRPAPGDETYYTFDSFEFSEEGLGVSSGPGSLVVDYRGDEKFMLILTGERLSYEYAPPREGADYYTKVEGADFHAVHELVKEEEKKDFIFTPARVEISCVPPICEKFLETLFSGLSTSTRDAMNRDMMEHIEEQFEETDENRDKNNFRDFYPVYDAEEGNLMYRVEVYKDRGDHWVALDYDNFEAREVSFIVKGYGPVFRYYSAETRASDIDLRTLEVRPDKGSRFYDITSVVGEVEMGTKNPEAMDGDVTFEVRAHVPVDRVEFFLWHFPSSTDTFDSLSKKQVLRVQSVTDDKGNDLTYIQYNPFQGLIFM